ncbi:metallophosphoesterase [Eubacteriales bacterium OttesenSCG-928-N13]|nr:metallophosphoesterase [Eubacteriales bacterium OttesenSCG-928-N13]
MPGDDGRKLPEQPSPSENRLHEQRERDVKQVDTPASANPSAPADKKNRDPKKPSKQSATPSRRMKGSAKKTTSQSGKAKTQQNMAKIDKQKKAASTRADRGKASRRALRQVGKTIQAGSASTVKYTRKAVGIFNAFTHSDEADVGATLTPIRRVMRFFSTITFPTFLLVAALIIAIAMMGFSNSNITVDRVTLSIVGLPRELEGYTIMHLGDLHGRVYGNAQSSLLRTLNSESYNLMVFTGDMVGASGNPQPFYDILDGLTANRQRYFIPGDSDPSPELTEVRQEGGTLEQMVLSDWVLGAQERGATYLAHTTPIQVSGTNLWLSPAKMLNLNLITTLNLLEEQVEAEKEGVVAGITSDRDALPLTSYRYNQLLMTHDASKKMQPTDIHIALSHMPPSDDYMAVAQQLSQEDTAAYLPTVDLTLAGHYCGGVWQVPGYGALYIPNSLYERHGWFPAREDVQGVKQLGLGTLYTTAGLGVTDDMFLPNFRLLNPPQVSVITLTAAITENLLGE